MVECKSNCQFKEMPLNSTHKCIKCKELVHAVCAHHIPDAPLGEENICTHCYKATDSNNISNGALPDSSTNNGEAKKAKNKAEKVTTAKKATKGAKKKAKPALTKAQQKQKKEFQASVVTATKLRYYEASDKMIITPSEAVQKKHGDSKIWKYFRKFQASSLCSLVACLKCQEAAKGQAENDIPKINYTVRVEKSNTSHLGYHLQAYHPDLYQEFIESKVGVVEGSTILRFCNNAKNHELYKKNLIYWIIDCNMPFSMVNQPSFRAMQMSLNKSAPIVDRKSMAQYILEQVTKDKPKIISLLRNRFISVTTDGWSCRSQHMHYVALTAHFIDDNWKLKSAFLACRSHSGSSTAYDQRDLILTILTGYEIEKHSVVALVTDTESTMSSLGRIMELSDGIPWVGCFDHRIQLVAKIAFEDTEDSINTMQMSRELVAAFQHSDQAVDVLLKLQVGSGRRAVVLKQDIVTRWWSTHAMIERLLRLKPFVEQCIDNHMISETYRLSQEQWGILEKNMKVLQPFKFVQKICEGESYVTATLIPTLLSQLRLGLINIVNGVVQNLESVKSLAKKMLQKFDLEFCNTLPGRNYFSLNKISGNSRRSGISEETLIGTALDPRTKSLIGVPQDDGSIDMLWNEVETRCFALRSNVSRVNREQDKPPIIAVPVNDVPEYLRDFAALLSSNDRDDAEEQSAPIANDDDSVRNSIRAEIVQYRKEPVLPMLILKRKVVCDNGTGEDYNDEEDNVEFADPLEWWKEYESQYPFLSTLAKRTLCIPASSAASERLFSAAGLTLANDRAHLVPYVAENLILLRKNWSLVHGEERMQ